MLQTRNKLFGAFSLEENQNKNYDEDEPIIEDEVIENKGLVFEKKEEKKFENKFFQSMKRIRQNVVIP